MPHSARDQRVEICLSSLLRRLLINTMANGYNVTVYHSKNRRGKNAMVNGYWVTVSDRERTPRALVGSPSLIGLMPSSQLTCGRALNER
jgi:hypothetical protein